MLLGVPSFAEHELEIVAAIGERCSHVLIRHGPAAEDDIEIVASALQEGTNRFLPIPANQ